MEVDSVLRVFDSRIQADVSVLLDSDDYGRLKDHTWHVDSGGYVRRTKWLGANQSPRTKTILMHRCILGVENESATEFCVDHINGNRLDNRKSNLRIVSYADNAANRHKVITQTGVLRISKWNRKYIARVRRHGVPVYVGSFPTLEEAGGAIDYYLETGQFLYPIRKIRSVAQRDLSGNVIAIYDNCKAASEKTGICSENINRVANHNRQRKKAGGFLWTFVDELEQEVP